MFGKMEKRGKYYITLSNSSHHNMPKNPIFIRKVHLMIIRNLHTYIYKSCPQIAFPHVDRLLISPMDKYKIDPEKAVAAMLYVASHIPGVRFHKLLKVIYFAELKHLANYGRPITGDRYVAMKDGPVASWLYDLLKKNVGEKYWNLFDIGFWAKSITPKSKPDLSVFSKSDIECLNSSIEENAPLTWEQIRDKSHDFAWTEAWNRRGTRKSIDIKTNNLVTVSGASPVMIEYMENRENYTITKSA